MMAPLPGRQLTDGDYARLLAVRDGLRRFLHWSEQRAAEAGLTAAQHQLLLTVRGYADRRGPTIGEIADHLLLRQHSVVGLVGRAEASGLVVRDGDARDGRVVRVRLSGRGRRALERLSSLHLEELRRVGGTLRVLWEGLDEPSQRHGRPVPGAGPT
jgi:DNA-binding MarR family transcriptional regulator